MSPPPAVNTCHVTGWRGFLGSHLVDRLARESCMVTLFDHRKHSLNSSESLRDFVRDAEVIYHLAGANRSENETLMLTNVLGTVRLLEAVRRFSSGNVKVIFSSSLHVYSPTKTLSRIREDTPSNPMDVYGLSKASAESALRVYDRQYGIRCVIIRLSNVYGPRCRPNYNSIISTLIFNFLNQSEIVINGSGNQARDFLYVSDAVEGIVKASCLTSETVNICSGTSHTVNETVSAIRSLCGRELKVRHIGESADDFLVGDPSKARNAVGFEPKTDFRSGIRETAAYFGLHSQLET